MKKYIAIIPILLIVVGWRLGRETLPQNLQTITIGATRLSVEVARTPSAIQKGLGQREEIGSDGMLFVMPSRGIPTFWMKDMLFSLDIVWIDNNIVVDVTENVDPQIAASAEQLRLYSPQQPVTHVVELYAGDVKKHAIQVGDAVHM